MILLPIQAPVTLDVRATSLAQALPRLGEVYGVPMRAAPAIGDEIVILSLRGTALDDLKARIATTFAAEWSVDKDGTFTLNRSVRLRNAEERAYFARREKGAGDLLEALRKEAAAAPPITPELMEETARTGKDPLSPPGPGPIMPERRLLAGLVAGLRPADLTGMSNRVVYSSAPTPMQRPFPLDIAPLVAAYEREQALMRGVFEEPNVNDDTPVSTAPVATLHLVVESNLEAVSVGLSGYDAAGRSITEASEELAFFSDNGPIQREKARGIAGVALAVAADESETPAPGARVFPISEESRAYSETLGTGGLFATIAQLAKARAGIRPFLDPVARDPLSYSLSDDAFEAARWTGRSVIVRPGDEQFVAGAAVLGGKPVSLSNALGLAKVDLTAPGWLVARPEYPYAIGLGFFPRPALRNALGLAFADGALTIGTATGIAALASETGIEPLLLALPIRLAFARTYLYLPALRAMAEMGETGRRRAASGVRFGDLSTDVRRRLSALMFGPSALAIRLKEIQPGFANPPGATDLEAEPTWLLPNGIPSDARVTVTTTNVDGVIPVDLALQSGRTFAPDLLAQRIFENRNPRLFAPGVVQQAARWSVARLQRAGRETTTLRVDLTPRHMLSFSHQSYDAASGPEFTMSSLPSDLRAAVDRAMVGVEARYRDAKPYVTEPAGESPPP